MSALKGSIWIDKRYGNRMQVDRSDETYVYGHSLIGRTSSTRLTRILKDQKTGGPRGYRLEEPAPVKSP